MNPVPGLAKYLAELNTKNLPQGVYIFEYTLNNKVHESGKWILRR